MRQCLVIALTFTLLAGCQINSKKYEFSNSTQQERAAAASAIASGKYQKRIDK